MVGISFVVGSGRGGRYLVQGVVVRGAGIDVVESSQGLRASGEGAEIGLGDDVRVPVFEDPLESTRVPVPVGGGVSDGVVDRIVAVEVDEAPDSAQVNGAEGAHSELEAIEEGLSAREAGEEGGLLNGAGDSRPMLWRRSLGSGDAHGALGHRVRGHDMTTPIEDVDVSRVDADGDGTVIHESLGHWIVGAVDGDVAVLLDDASLGPGGGIGDSGKSDETGLLFGEGLVDPAVGGAVHSDIGHGIQPLTAPLVEIAPGGEFAAG